MIDICFECESPHNIEYHHVVPRSLGGTKTIPLCNNCHGKVHGIKRMHMSTLTKEGLQKARARGVKLGNPSNLTQQGREKGVQARKANAANNPNTKAAKDYALMLRNSGLALRTIAERLNKEGFKTARGGQYSAVQVQRIL